LLSHTGVKLPVRKSVKFDANCTRLRDLTGFAVVSAVFNHPRSGQGGLSGCDWASLIAAELAQAAP
jgi:hypothetical protein